MSIRELVNEVDDNATDYRALHLLTKFVEQLEEILIYDNSFASRNSREDVLKCFKNLKSNLEAEQKKFNGLW